MRWMLSADSPLYIKPAPNIDFLKWLFGFWRACNWRAFTAGTEATANLNKRTFELFDQMQADGVKFEMRRDGIFYVYYSPLALEEDLKGLEPLKQYNVMPTQTLWGRTRTRWSHRSPMRSTAASGSSTSAASPRMS
jgi:hypothetical protein